MSVQTYTNTRTFVLCLLRVMWTVRDVRRMMTGANFCWQIVTFTWSTRTDEDDGCISFGNQEMMENILNCARYRGNFPISSENITEWILDSVKDDLQGYCNFRRCIQAEEKLTVALRYVLVIGVRINITYICTMLNAIKIQCNLKRNYTIKSHTKLK